MFSAVWIGNDQCSVPRILANLLKHGVYYVSWTTSNFIWTKCGNGFSVGAIEEWTCYEVIDKKVISKRISKYRWRPQVQSQKTQGFCVADFATLSDERRSCSKIFPLFIWIKEPCVRKFEGLERSKLLGISQTKVCWHQTTVAFIYVFPATKMNRVMLKIVVIENLFPLQIKDEISWWLMTALGFRWSNLWHWMSKLF